MFAKKFLSSGILSLFIGYHFMKVSAAGIDLDECGSAPTTEESGGDPATGICFSGKTIYAIKADTTKFKSSVNLDTGLNVLSIVDNVITKDTLGQAFTDKSKLALLYCDATSCAQTFGYVHDNANWIMVKSSTDSADVASNASALDCSTGSNDDVGLIRSTGEFCLKSGLTATSTEGNYIMTTASATGPIPDINSAITIVTNAVVWNPKLNDEFCFTTASNLITNRKENYCDSNTNACNDYYTCTAGICELTTTTYKRREGECDPTTGNGCNGEDDGEYYYIGSGNAIGDGLVTSAGVPGNLFVCTISSGTLEQCAKTTNIAGYLRNADTENDIPYIQCTVGSTSSTCKGMMDAPETVANCAANNNGYIEVGNVYKKCKDGVDNNADVLDYVIGTTCVNDGDLIKDGDYKLCIKSNSVVFGEGSYFIEADKTSVFNDADVAGHFVAIDIDTDKAVLNQDVTPIKYRYAIDSSRKIVGKGDDASMCTGAIPSLDTSYGHEFEKVREPEGAAADHIHYYKDNNSH